MSNFAKKVQDTVKSNQSCLILGIDPVIESFPNSITEHIHDEQSFEDVLINFYDQVINQTKHSVAGYKPNIAFFEAYGLPGLKVFSKLCELINTAKSILIVDAKRGDIGSTADAYSRAFFRGSHFKNLSFQIAKSDALTVNTFLGLDTIEPFLNDCKKLGTGIFLLVKTSNPGSDLFQKAKIENDTISNYLAKYINLNSDTLASGELTGLGAVVGSTYPEDARKLRQLMPKSIFLVPGYGAQGGTAADALAGYTVPGSILVNSSRGIFGNIESNLSISQYLNLIMSRINSANNDLRNGCL